MKGIEIVFSAGLIAGSLDLTATGLLLGAQGVPFQRLLQTIASGMRGPKAFEQGSRSAALGLFLHFLIALTAATAYFAASRFLPSLLDRPILAGVLFGVAVHLFMALIVVPLSKVGRPFSAKSFLIQLGIHILFVGLPISLTISRLSRAV